MERGGESRQEIERKKERGVWGLSEGGWDREGGMDRERVLKESGEGGEAAGRVGRGRMWTEQRAGRD